MSDFPEQWKQALASESVTKVPLEVVVTCAFHGRVLEPLPAEEAEEIVGHPDPAIWFCPTPNCPVKTHITIRTPAPQEEA